jgi:ferredoxin-nitrite reductase
MSESILLSPELAWSGEDRPALHDDPHGVLDPSQVKDWPDDALVCPCKGVAKGVVVASIRDGHASLATLAHHTGAGTTPTCTTCKALLGQLIAAYKPRGPAHLTPAVLKANKVEAVKLAKDGLDCLDDILGQAQTGNWAEMTEEDKHRFKWYGLFFRKQTPGHFMLRLRATCGFMNSQQFRVIADLSDQYGKGFCDLTTRQQVQLRWFTLADVPEMWDRLAAVGLSSQQTGMDNVRGVCGCPVSGLTPHELFDAAPVGQDFTRKLLGNKSFTNLPRKFNVTITGCLENCCHTETQDLALVPSYRELDGSQVNGFNVLVGGKQGSGGYDPAQALDVFVRPEDAAELCAHVVGIFRDHGSRETRIRARLFFLIRDLGLTWFRAELERRMGRPLLQAGTDLRKHNHVDHIGIHPQKHPAGAATGQPALFYVGLLVPVGRLTTTQLRGVADLADRYGNGEIRLTVQQNLIFPNVPEDRIGALTQEPLLRELQFDPSPVMRGLVACVGNDYCHLALIETKGWALEVARELERRTTGKKIQPLTIHWSGCSAGCGLHQVSTIGLQGCRTRIDGQVVDAAHVYVKGQSGPSARVAEDLMYDVPCDQLADALEPLVKHLPRK